MNNTPKILPVPPPRARQETVIGMGGGMDDEKQLLQDPRIAELEQQNAQLEAQIAMLDAALQQANAAHKAAELEVDATRATHQADLAKLAELNEMLTAMVHMTGDEMAIYLRDWLKRKDARIQELERGVASRYDIFNVFLTERERMLMDAIKWVHAISEEFGKDLNDPELQSRLITRIKEIHTDLDDAQIRMALSSRAPTTRPVRDSETYIEPLEPKSVSKASRSPRPEEISPATQPSRAIAQPVTMPPIGSIASSPPQDDDGVVELDIDDPNNPGRATWNMGDPPPVR